MSSEQCTHSIANSSKEIYKIWPSIFDQWFAFRQLQNYLDPSKENPECRRQYSKVRPLSMIVFWLYFDCIHLLRCILVAALWGIYIVFSWILLYFGGTRRCLCSAWNCTSRSICFWNSSHASSSSKRWLGGATRGKWGSLCQKKWRKIVTFWGSSTFCCRS